jgi:uncharacterized OsmC-like protein
VEIRAKHFDYWVTLGDEGLSADGTPVDLAKNVSAEHLLLAGLARCTIESLVYFARQKDLDVHASAYASGTVTRREEDDRYAFTNIECRLDIDIDRELDAEALRSLVESAEWGCFVGASLNPAPKYKWRVNGRNL